MKIFFLRHTSLDVDKNIFYGQTDLDVSNSFNHELRIIKEKIKDEGINLSNFLVFSSPLIRCLKLAKSLSKDIHIDPRLKEMNLGDWEMKKFSSIEKNELEKNCHSTVILDGDNIRQILSEEQKYTKKERLSLAYKYANLAKIINRYNINVIVSTTNF